MGKIILAVLLVASTSHAAILGLNFTAVTDGDLDVGLYPPDVGAAVGGGYAVIQTNGSHQVFDSRSGAAVAASDLGAFWAAASPFDRAFDPRVVYRDGRWYAVAVDALRDPNQSGVLLATTTDPTAGWTMARWRADPTSNRFADFPMLGVAGDEVYVSINMFGVDRVATNVSYELTRLSVADLAAGNVANRTRSFLPAHTNMASVGSDRLIRVDMDSPNRLKWQSTDGITGGTIDFGTNYSWAQRAQQPGVRGLETDYNGPSQATVEVNGSLWGVFTVLAQIGTETKNVAHWFELDADTMAIRRHGIVGLPDWQNVLYPSIAASADGQVLIGFSASGYANYASAWAVGGRVEGDGIVWDDPLLLHEGLAAYDAANGVGRNRWGDYSSTVFDEESGAFWTFQLYAASGDQWAVQASQVMVPEPSTGAVLVSFSAMLLGHRRSRCRKPR